MRRGLSVVQDKKVGAKGRRAVYDVATEHEQVVIINCHIPHGKRVKEYVALKQAQAQDIVRLLWSLNVHKMK